MPEFVFPTAAELTEISRELTPRLAEGRAIFDILPLQEEDSHILMWEQRDNFVGLQQIRGLNGPPQRVQPVGGRRFLMMPGVYGEFMPIDETELTVRRQFGVWDRPIDISDLVRERQDQLLARRLDRIEQIGWTLVATGTFAVAQGNKVMHTDTFTLQTYAAATPWATVAAATPLADFRAVQLKSRGYSVDFGSGARAYMNRTTWNQLMSNTNPNDLGGKKGQFGASLLSPQGITQVMAAEDLPTPVIYDQGYYDEAGAFQLFVPNNKVIVVGRRLDNDRVGEFRLTRNANNPNMAPGPYMKVVNDPDRVPPAPEVHDGFNGGPVLYHPGAVVVMTI